MKFIKIISTYCFLLSIICCTTNYSKSSKKLDDNWVFKCTSDSIWRPAIVPGTVHTDLLENNVIENPFFRNNEHNLQWVDKESWEYKTSFFLSEKEINFKNIQLIFNGLDTYSTVYLNDSLLFSSENMFLRYFVDVKRNLKLGENGLKVIFKSPIKEGIKKHDSIGYTVPVSGNDLAIIGKVKDGKQVSVFSRKAPYHFGWDWGPRLVTSGIWRPVELKMWNGVVISDFHINQISINEVAKMVANIELSSDEKNSVVLDLFVNQKIVIHQKISITKGKNSISIPFQIENPKRWWPNGMGEQALYDVQIKVSTANSIDSNALKIGLREIELVQKPDSIGAAFYFKINGIPTFAKGANYIPQDVFLPRVNKEKYKHILSSAAAANMNMIRVWGGGVYESDLFYDLCDSLGLMVWQDFMFACSMYPGNKEFFKSISLEAVDNVKRLRNHPSIVLWCGNNEVLSAWKRWGWENEAINNQSKEIASILWKTYETIFHEILPNTVDKHSPQTPYWSASPSSRTGIKSSNFSGDMHYWGVWWGGESFTAYETEIPRFMSEFGFQSFPEYNSVKKFTNENDHTIYSDVMKSHQRSSIGNKTIEKYLLRNYKKPKNFESFLYVSQLLQGYGIRLGTEAHRRNRDRCMGSLYWQLNDCWPVASWSSIDYYGKWKALHFEMKKAFSNVIISNHIENDSLICHVVSDSVNPFEGILMVSVLDFKGKELKALVKKAKVMPNSSIKELKFSLQGFDKSTSFIKAALISNNKIIANSNYFLAPFKFLNLKKPEIEFEINRNRNEYELTFESNSLAIDVFLSLEKECSFSDNYFDLIPGEKKHIFLKIDEEIDKKYLYKNLKIVTLADTY